MYTFVNILTYTNIQIYCNIQSNDRLDIHRKKCCGNSHCVRNVERWIQPQRCRYRSADVRITGGCYSTRLFPSVGTILLRRSCKINEYFSSIRNIAMSLVSWKINTWLQFKHAGMWRNDTYKYCAYPREDHGPWNIYLMISVLKRSVLCYTVPLSPVMNAFM